MSVSPRNILKHGRTVEDVLEDLCDRIEEHAPKRLVEAIAYSLIGGGKRLRPALLLEAFAACGGTDERSAGAAAGAVELIHCFSLVHDDLPAMDDDDLRRGRPTNHKVFGDAMAILAGDAMQTLAFELLATQADAAIVPSLVRELSAATGPVGMIGGQVLDMETENSPLLIDELRRVHALKTGALLRCSVRMGAICARADEPDLDRLTDFGERIGLAFQIVDDLLDVTATADQLGKAVKKDATRGKNTFPSLLGVEASRRLADAELSAALASIAPLGPKADELAAIARFVVERNH